MPNLATFFDQSAEAPVAERLVQLLRGQRQVAALSKYWWRHARESKFNEYSFTLRQWEFLQKHQVKDTDTLDLRGDALASDFVTGLLVWLRFRSNVQRIFIGAKGSQAVDVLALKGSQGIDLQRVCLRRLDEQQVRPVIMLLHCHHSLQVLDLSNNILQSTGAQLLAFLLSQQYCTITDLNLARTHIAEAGDEEANSSMESGVLSLVRSFAANRSLQRIELRGNNFGDELGLALVSALRARSSRVPIETLCGIPTGRLLAAEDEGLLDIDLSTTEWCGSTSRTDVADESGRWGGIIGATETGNDTEPDEASSGALKLGVGEVAMLARLLQPPAQAALGASAAKGQATVPAIFPAASSAGVASITSLNLRSNMMLVEGAKAIARAISTGVRSLTRLDVSDNAIGMEGGGVVAKAVLTRAKYSVSSDPGSTPPLQPLRRLKMGGNRLQAEGLAVVSSVLLKLSQLQAQIRAQEGSGANCMLHELSLQDNILTDWGRNAAGLEQLLSAAVQAANVTATNAVSPCWSGADAIASLRERVGSEDSKTGASVGLRVLDLRMNQLWQTQGEDRPLVYSALLTLVQPSACVMELGIGRGTIALGALRGQSMDGGPMAPLTRLELENCSLNMRGALVLVEALLPSASRSPALAYLDVRSNEIGWEGREGIEALALLATEHTALISIHVAHNCADNEQRDVLVGAAAEANAQARRKELQLELVCDEEEYTDSDSDCEEPLEMQEGLADAPTSSSDENSDMDEEADDSTAKIVAGAVANSIDNTTLFYSRPLV
jgi:Ran GTPase-activating protein (RanGAP) involved in mRNA processing and transport